MYLIKQLHTSQFRHYNIHLPNVFIKIFHKLNKFVFGREISVIALWLCLSLTFVIRQEPTAPPPPPPPGKKLFMHVPMEGEEVGFSQGCWNLKIWGSFLKLMTMTKWLLVPANVKTCPCLFWMLQVIIEGKKCTWKFNFPGLLFMPQFMTLTGAGGAHQTFLNALLKLHVGEYYFQYRPKKTLGLMLVGNLSCN